MKTRSLALTVLLVASSALAVKPDKPGCKDHPLFPTRMPNYYIAACEAKEFASHPFKLQKGKTRTVEGKYTFITYSVDDRKDDQTGEAVVRNYENALKKIGGTVADSVPNWWVNGSVVVDGKEVWAEAERGNGKIWLRIVEKQEMVQHVVADAAAFRDGLKAKGHVAVEGIYFDTGKAILKPESTPALQEVAKLLGADPSLKLWVVGHTDSVGQADANMKLSQARAEAVVTALTTTHGITAARLKGYGVGPLAPVASNDSEDGRAKNRRVELVKQ
jgi:outer membrane protein OmpA-like peptidoglycan-associated protein